MNSVDILYSEFVPEPLLPAKMLATLPLRRGQVRTSLESPDSDNEEGD